MDPITLAALIQAVPALFQAGTGIVQSIQGKRMAEGLTDPIYNIPASQQAALEGAKQQAVSRYMSGQTALQDQLNQGTANAMSDIMRTGRSPQDVLAAMTTINARNQNNQLNLGFQAAQDYQRRQADLRGEQHMMAGFEDKKWTNDVLNKFLRDSAAASALRNGGMNNLFQGVKGAANAGSAIALNEAGEGGGMGTNQGNMAYGMLGGANAGVTSGMSSVQPRTTQTQVPTYSTPYTTNNYSGKSDFYNPMGADNSVPVELQQAMAQMSPQEISTLLDLIKTQE